MLNFDNNNNIPSTSADMSNNLEELIFPSTSLRVPDRPNIERRKEGCFQILFYPLIKMSCTEQSIWALSTLCGLFVLCAQTAPIFLLDWVHIREPRPLNLPKEPSSLINDDRGPLEIPFEYNAGYFGMCRYWIATNESLLLNNANNPSTDFLLPLSELNKLIPKLAPDACVWNSAYSGEDLSEFSFATSAILVRLLIPTIMHCSGALLTVFALLFSFLGHFGHNWKTIFSAILYVFGGLIIFIGVLQVICIVDDEMAPRMKPNAAGEPSVFTFRSSFMAAALSFLPVQLCVWLEVTAFFLRHKTPTDKSLVVPGLNELLNQVTIIRTRTHRLGRLGGFSLQGGNNNNCGGSSGRFSNRRRSSRASKDLSGILNNNNLNNDSSIIIKKDYSFHHLLV